MNFIQEVQDKAHDIRNIPKNTLSSLI